jgi:hypothetical protein
MTELTFQPAGHDPVVTFPGKGGDGVARPEEGDAAEGEGGDEEVGGELGDVAERDGGLGLASGTTVS